jgi:hypothetical protein
VTDARDELREAWTAFKKEWWSVCEAPEAIRLDKAHDAVLAEKPNDGVRLRKIEEFAQSWALFGERRYVRQDKLLEVIAGLLRSDDPPQIETYSHQNELREQVERLTKERDEARSKVEQLRELTVRLTEREINPMVICDPSKNVEEMAEMRSTIAKLREQLENEDMDDLRTALRVLCKEIGK